MIYCIYHGHSFFEIKFNETSIFIDPFINGNKNCDISLNEIKNINVKYIILTHGHQDHIGDSIDICKIKNNSIKIIGIFELCKYFEDILSYKNTHSMNIGGSFDFELFRVKLVNAVHSNSIGDIKLGYYSNPCGIIIRINGYNIYHAGDTGLAYDMKLLGEYDNIYLSMIPIGDNFTMGIEDGVLATSFIKSKYVIPMHYDTFDLIKSDPLEFSKLVLKDNISIPKILKPGQYFLIN